jgi:uncharacterized alkaline shock family protein YloU
MLYFVNGCSGVNEIDIQKHYSGFCIISQGELKMGESKGYIRNMDEKGSVNISEDVIAIIAAAATMEVAGVHCMFSSYGKEITSVLSKRALSKGVRLHIDGENIVIDVHIIAMAGYPVNEVGADIQRAVVSAIEAAVGVTVCAVNVHICGVSLNRAKKQA